jgi:hypothetical protein
MNHIMGRTQRQCAHELLASTNTTWTTKAAAPHTTIQTLDEMAGSAVNSLGSSSETVIEVTHNLHVPAKGFLYINQYCRFILLPQSIGPLMQGTTA